MLKKMRIDHRIHPYDHDPGAPVYGEEAADKLGIPYERIFKTLVVALDNRSMAVALVPVSAQLDLKKMAKAAGVKKAVMADRKSAERTTGYLIGGISPLAQKKKLFTVIHPSAFDFETIYISAGRCRNLALTHSLAACFARSLGSGSVFCCRL